MGAEVFANLAGIDYGVIPKSKKKKKKKAMKDALNWIRSNDPMVGNDPDEDLVNALSKITGKPLPDNMTPQAQKEFVDESMDWLREFDPGRLDAVDDATAEVFTSLAGINYEGRPKSMTLKKNLLTNQWIGCVSLILEVLTQLMMPRLKPSQVWLVLIMKVVQSR